MRKIGYDNQQNLFEEKWICQKIKCIQRLFSGI